VDAYDALEAIDPLSGLVNAVIDTPKGSNGKYKHDPESGLFRLSKLLPLGAYFPYNFGFVPQTRGDDGDELDILVIMDEPLHIGAVVPVRIIGVLRSEQSETEGQAFRNDRLLGVLETKHNPPEVHHYKDLSPQRLAEIEHFFLSYNLMEGRAFKSLGRGGPQEALELIRKHQLHPAEV
jgi:inorganic pyrophosphatase